MRNDWIFCDGEGRLGRSRVPPVRRESGAFAPTRRGLILGATLGTVGWLGRGSALAGFSVSPERPDHVLVVLFLRGGMDGLGAVQPLGDEIQRLRPNLALPDSELVPLDDRFGLHPALGALAPLWAEKRLGVIHAIGSQDETRSHFEAMSAMDRGTADDGAGPSSGWIARHLQATARPDDSPLRAVAFGTAMPDSLRGARTAAALPDLASYRLKSDRQDHQQLVELIRKRYAAGEDAASEAGRATLQVMDALHAIPGDTPPANGAQYPETGMGQGFRQCAQLLRAGVGLEVATVDAGGWDTHVAQGRGTGWLADRLKEVGDVLAAFFTDLGSDAERVSVVAVSEFGRRAYENGGLGTDHGRATSALVLGNGVAGGRVYGDWPGLERDQLEGPGDLRVTTDYRTLLAELIEGRLGGDAGTVFPGWKRARLGVLAPKSATLR